MSFIEISAPIDFIRKSRRFQDFYSLNLDSAGQKTLRQSYRVVIDRICRITKVDL